MYVFLKTAYYKFYLINIKSDYKISILINELAER
jgi:hypothetical protein